MGDFVTSMISNGNRCVWSQLLMHDCPKAEIRAVDSQSDLKILLKL